MERMGAYESPHVERTGATWNGFVALAVGTLCN
jgi:hypothetical protein